MMTPYKSRNTAPALEDFKLNTGYAFTLNPCDRFQYWEIEDRMIRVIRKVRNFLNRDYIMYKIYPEISKGGRIHFHGYIWCNDALKLYRDAIHELGEFSTYEIDTISNEDIWEDYITKQCAIIKFQYLFKPYGLLTSVVYKTNEGWF